MKDVSSRILVAALGALLATALGLSPASARVPTADRLTLDLALAYGERFDAPNPYAFGAATRMGYTFGNGLHVGAMADWFPKHRIEVGQAQLQAGALRVGGALGLDLKLAATVSGRLSAGGGVMWWQRDAGSQPGPPLDEGHHIYAGPALTLLLLLSDPLYLKAGARLDFVFGSDIDTVTVAELGFGVAL